MDTYYLHTLDGKPAEFWENQICFATFYGKAALLARDLKQIRHEQKLSKTWRKKQGFNAFLEEGYVRVRTPESKQIDKALRKLEMYKETGDKGYLDKAIDVLR